MTAKIEVLLFARLRDLAGSDRVRIEVPLPIMAQKLRAALARLLPDAADLLARCAVAADGVYQADDEPINPHAEIAIIPPVSGG
ncbi:MAG: MoaD/ThiS family protein [Gemmataceae bacterium]|nr:MoaD/ThiS family protein [Gemmataceae bacterium]